MFDLRSGTWTALDVAGGAEGGAARWRGELDAYLTACHPVPVHVVGRGRRLNMRWMLEREHAVGRSPLVIAANNVSFAVAGSYRVVLARNALHFLYPHEEHLLDRMPRGWRQQIPMARAMMRRCDEIVVPSQAMRDRVEWVMPRLANRLAVRMHPITPVARRQREPFILVPVVPGPYKNLFPQLRTLVTALHGVSTDTRVRVRVTARPEQLPADIAATSEVIPIGSVTHHQLRDLWRTAAAIFYPSIVEAFGYPLAEARASGIPVIAPDTPQAREIAGNALRPYTPSDPQSLADALRRIDEPLEPDPATFDPNRYFDGLLGVGDAVNVASRWA